MSETQSKPEGLEQYTVWDPDAENALHFHDEDDAHERAETAKEDFEINPEIYGPGYLPEELSEEYAPDEDAPKIEDGAEDFEVIEHGETPGKDVIGVPNEDEPADAEPVDAESGEPTDLPDRSLTDDPINWLSKGDGELTANIKGTTVITKKGFRVLQHHYDISTGSEVLVGPEENGHEFCRVKAWAEMPDGRRAEAHASAHVDRDDDHFLLVSMADTRAKSRALSDVTGVGAVAIEEMQGVENDG